MKPVLILLLALQTLLISSCSDKPVDAASTALPGLNTEDLKDIENLSDKDLNKIAELQIYIPTAEDSLSEVKSQLELNPKIRFYSNSDHIIIEELNSTEESIFSMELHFENGKFVKGTVLS